jgi:hypothetical protein
VLRIADMAYQPRARRFVILLNRFDWTPSLGAMTSERRRAALRFDQVRAVRRKSLPQGASDQVLSLLALRFESTDAPAGSITLVFSGGATLRLDVEAIEAELRDLGAAWSARRPDHGGGNE